MNHRHPNRSVFFFVWAILLLGVASMASGQSGLGIPFPAQGYRVSESVAAIEKGDFNGDGLVDFACTSSHADEVVVVFNQGNAVMSEPVRYPMAGGPVYIKAGDFDDDGDLDLLVTVSQSEEMVVLLNDGQGAMIEWFRTDIGPAVIDVEIGDLDGDADLDVVFLQRYTRLLVVHFNRGDGVFDQSLESDGGNAPRSISLGDVDDDGDLDLALALWGAAAKVMFNDGSGGFGETVSFATSHSVYPVKLADLNNDGLCDLLIGESGSSMRILMSDGKGGFESRSQPQPLYVAGEFTAIHVEDWDHDGDMDLGLIGSGYGLEIYLNSGQGTFSRGTKSPVGFQPRNAVVSDLNCDGELDLAVGFPNGLVSTIFGNQDGTIVSEKRYIAYEERGLLTFGDIDGDGDKDAVINRFPRLDVTIQFNDGEGNFGEPVLKRSDCFTKRIVLADIDGDGDLDGVSACRNINSDRFLVIPNGEHGLFSGTQVEYRVWGEPTMLRVGDMNGDFAPDVIMTLNTSEVVVALNNGIGEFSTMNFLQTDHTEDGLACGDIDGDSDLDVIVAGSRSKEFSVLLNDGHGVLHKASAFGGSYEIRQIELVDLDGDSDLDLVAEEGNEGALLIYHNDGEGNFTFAESLWIPGEWSRFSVGDVNRDGYPDIGFSTGGSEDEVGLYLQGEDGTFGDALWFAAGGSPMELSLDDLNGDGYLDMAVTVSDRNSRKTEYIGVYLNQLAGVCAADINGDHDLDSMDLFAFIDAFQAQSPIGDFTQDCRFNFYDVSAYIIAYLAGCP